MITSKFIWDAFEKYSNEIIYIDSSTSYSYKAFYEQVCEISSCKQLQYEIGERVALTVDSSFNSLVKFFALLYNGAIPVLLSNKFPLDKVRMLLNSIDCVNQIDNLSNEKSHEVHPYKETRDATVIFTSGSSSLEKAVLHTYANHYYSALGSNKNLPFQISDRWLMSLPPHHIGGFSIIFRAILNGGTLVGYENTVSVEQTIETLQVTHLSVVPTQLRRMMLFPEKLKSLKAILVGGGFIPDDLLSQALDLNLPIYKTYGMSEMSSQVTTTSHNASPDELATSGKILKYRELKIADDNEILVRGEVLCKNYLNADFPIDSDGWFHTGDIGSLDSNGYLTVEGRKDNMFVSGGENIYPEPIEKILLQMQNIAEVCIIPKDDIEFGQVPVLFYKPSESGKCTQEEVKEYLKDKVLPFEIPKEIFEFPKEYQSFGIKVNRQFFKNWLDNS